MSHEQGQQPPQQGVNDMTPLFESRHVEQVPLTATEILLRQQAARDRLNEVRHLYDSIPLRGTELIAREREEQMYRHGWSDEHDDMHTGGELAIVAAIVAVHPLGLMLAEPMHGAVLAWPSTWDETWRGKIFAHTRIEQLAIAGALIAAEIDRLQRQAMEAEREEKARNRARVADSNDLR